MQFKRMLIYLFVATVVALVVVILVRRKRVTLSWVDNILLGSLLTLLCGVLTGLGLHAAINGALDAGPSGVAIYNGIPVTGQMFWMIAWFVALMFFVFGVYEVIAALVRYSKGDKKYHPPNKKPAQPRKY